MTGTEWMIYGASGFTGKMIAEEALRQGHHPILAGRSAAKLQPLAEQMGLTWRTFDLTDPAAIRTALHGVGVLLNTAGPFVNTAQPLIDACLVEGTHYLDLSNERLSFQYVWQHAAEAEQRGIALIPGVGFGVVVTNALIAYLAARMPNAVAVECAIAPENIAEGGVGATLTVLETLPQGAWLYKGGQASRARLGANVKVVQFPDKPRQLLPFPLGDLEAAYHATHMPNVTAYGVFEGGRATRAMLPVIRRVLSIRFVRQQIIRRIEKRAAVEKAQPAKTEYRSFGWAHVVDAQGNDAQAWLETGEGYRFTTLSSIRAVARTLAEHPHGALTPAQAFGADFALEIEGVRRYDSLPVDAPVLQMGV